PGREVELGALVLAGEAAATGSGAAVVVSGEAGIGKTRLVEEATRRLEAAGAEVRWGRCFEGQGAPAFWPWLQVLRGMVAHRDAATLRRQAPVGAAAIAHLVPELLPALDAPPTAVGPTSGPFELYDAVTRFLVAASHDQPLVV